MPRPKSEVRITNTMIAAAGLYDDGYSAGEIAVKLKRTREYIIWSLGIMDVPVDEAQISPNGKAGKTFAKEWNQARELVLRGMMYG